MNDFNTPSFPTTHTLRTQATQKTTNHTALMAFDEVPNKTCVPFQITPLKFSLLPIYHTDCLKIRTQHIIGICSVIDCLLSS